MGWGVQCLPSSRTLLRDVWARAPFIEHLKRNMKTGLIGSEVWDFLRRLAGFISNAG